MASTRITVTLPSEQVEGLRKITDNLSGYIADAVDRQVRRDLIAVDLRRYEAEHGNFTDEELAAAYAELYGPAADSDIA